MTKIKKRLRRVKNTKKLEPHPSKTRKFGSRLKKLFTDARQVKRIIFFGILVTVSLWIFWGIPLPTQLASHQVPVSTKLFDRNGNLLYEIYADKRSDPIELEQVPDYVWRSTISIEDKDFFRHYGISFTGMMRAVYKTTV